MSMYLMTQIWRTCLYRSGTLITLMAMADVAEDDGTRIYPGIDTLAAKCRLSTQAVMDCIARLRADGVLILLGEEDEDLPAEAKFVGGRGRFARYRIEEDRLHEMQAQHRLDCPECEGCAAREKRAKLKSEKGQVSRERVQTGQERVKSASPHIDNNPSSVTHPENPPGKPGTAIAVMEAPSELEIAVEAFNLAAKTCPKWTSCISTSHARKAAILARLKEHGLDGWRRAVALASASGHLGGPVPTSGSHQGWRMDIGWFAKAEHFGKILEGGYAPARGATNSREASRAGLLQGIEEASR